VETFAATVEAIRDVAPDVRAFRLLVEGDAISFEPGGHIDVEVQVAGVTQVRSYSFFSVGGEAGLVVAVKLAVRGHGGSAYMWSLTVGARLRVRRARNTLPVSYGSDRYVLVAGGIGITPLIAVARALREAGKALSLHYCVRKVEVAPFLPELHALLGDDLIVHASDAGDHLDIEALVSLADANTVHYVCGPLGLMEAVNRAWHRRELPRKNLRFETFGNSGQLPTGTFEVLVHETGVRLLVPETESLLDALIAAGQDIMYECRRGECGLCKVEIDSVEGEIDHRDVFLSDHERAANAAMCCCVSRVHGGSIAIRIDGITHGRSSQAAACAIPAS
jgi:dimethylamine monooxygenase subunit B